MTLFCYQQHGRILSLSSSYLYGYFLRWNQFYCYILKLYSIALYFLSYPYSPSSFLRTSSRSACINVYIYQAFGSLTFQKLNGYCRMDDDISEPMSFEDSIIYLKAGSTIIGAFDLWFSNMIEQVWSALLIGETKTTSTSISFTFQRAYFACSIPLYVIYTSKYFLSNFASKYMGLSKQCQPTCFYIYFSAELQIDQACLIKYSINNIELVSQQTNINNVSRELSFVCLIDFDRQQY